MKVRFAISFLAIILAASSVTQVAARAVPAGGSITGTVTNAMTGAPVPGATIIISSTTSGFVDSARTNAAGVYTTTIGLATGSYFVVAYAPNSSGLLNQLYDSLLCQYGCDPKSGTPVPVTSPDATTVNIALPVGGTIAGTARDARTGTPVANVGIDIYRSDGQPATSTFTNAQGVYATTSGLPAGSYFVRASPSTATPYLWQLHSNVGCHNANCSITSGTPVAVAAPGTATVDFALLAGAKITGTVTNAATNEPIPNLGVEFYASTGLYAGSGTTNAQGVYVSSSLVPGPHFVLANSLSQGGFASRLYGGPTCAGKNCNVATGTPVMTTASNTTPNINVALAPIPLAPNDSYATATVIGDLPFESVVSTVHATSAHDDPAMSCTNNNNLRSVWYVYTPTFDGQLHVDPAGSSSGTFLAIYTGSPGDFTEVACIGYYYPQYFSAAAIVKAGETVTILVKSSSIFDVLVLNVSVQPSYFSKVSPADAATARPTSATLSWDTSPNAVGYEYCIDTNHNSACDSYWAPAGNVTSVDLAGLRPNTLYSWNVRAVSAGAISYADGMIQTFRTFRTGPFPLVELNNDGNGDVFVHNPVTGQYQQQVTQANGGFATTFTGSTQGWDVVPASFDQDGLTDFFFINPTSGQWYKLLNSAAGLVFQSFGSWWPDWKRYVSDLDGDGISDVFLYDPVTGVWFTAISTPTGFSYRQGAWDPGWEIYPTRLNDDSFGDLFLFNRTTGRWYWSLGAADGDFTYPVTGTWFSGWLLFPGDFNGDELSDLLLHDPVTGTYFIALTSASGFTFVQGGWSVGWMPLVMDFNADHKDDLFLHDPATGIWFQMIGDGDGYFNVAGQATWSLGWTLHPIDFNGDGRADLLLYDPSTGAYYQARNLANGIFAYSGGSWAPGLTVLTRTPVR